MDAFIRAPSKDMFSVLIEIKFISHKFIKTEE